MPKPPLYLDNNATTPLDPRVLEAMMPVLKEHFGNPASATHAYGWHAAELVKIAREQVAALINARPDEIVFTSGATESMNLAILGIVRAIHSKDSARKIKILSSAIEHRATLDPIRMLAESGQIEASVLGVNQDGTLETKQLFAECDASTALVSLMLGNNEIGSVFPIAEIGAELRKRHILLHCDAAQAAGKLSLDVAVLKVDLMSLSAHKMYGPKGAGALFVRREIRALLSPLLFGGGHEEGLRAGTLNVAGIVGLGKAAELAKTELVHECAQLEALSARLLSRLREAVPSLRLNGPSENRLPGNLNLVFPGVDNARLIGCIQNELAVSTSSACHSAEKSPSHVLKAIGLSLEDQRSSVRLGLGRFTSAEDIDLAVSILAKGVAQSLS